MSLGLDAGVDAAHCKSVLPKHWKFCGTRTCALLVLWSYFQISLCQGRCWMGLCVQGTKRFCIVQHVLCWYFGNTSNAHSAGLPRLEDAHWPAAWDAIRGVWASQWNERAVVSMRRAGLDPACLRMAVLCQTTLPAQHAFVSHTSNPLTGQPPHSTQAPLRMHGKSCPRPLTMLV